MSAQNLIGGKPNKAAKKNTKDKKGNKVQIQQMGAGSALINFLDDVSGAGGKAAKDRAYGAGADALIGKGVGNGIRAVTASAAKSSGGSTNKEAGPLTGTIMSNGVPVPPMGSGAVGGASGGSTGAAVDESNMTAAERRRRRGRQSLIIQLLTGAR